jgi:hypothetical protein
MKCEHFESVKDMTRPVEVGMWLHFLYPDRDDAFLVLGVKRQGRDGKPWVVTFYEAKKRVGHFDHFAYYPLEGFNTAHAHVEYPWR